MVNIDERRILEAFMEEVRELLELLNHKLLELETSPQDQDVINEIFRLTHSVKSESALVGFKNISILAHKMEDIFERVRRGVLIVDKPIMDALFQAFDRVMLLLNAAQNGEDEGVYDVSDVVNPLLEILNEKKMSGSTSSKEKPSAKPASQPSQTSESESTVLKVEIKQLDSLKGTEFSDIEKNMIEESVGKGEKFYKIIFHIEDECDMKYPRAYLVYNNFENSGSVIKTVPDIINETNDDKFSSVTLYMVTSSDIESLKSCADVDQVDRLDVFEVTPKGVSECLNIDNGISEIVSSTDIESAEEIEKKWAEEMMKSQASQSDETEVLSDDKGKLNIAEVKKEIGKNAEKIAQKQTIRVDIERLDELLNLVGELIINRSRFIQITDNVHENAVIQDLKTELEDATNELERISDQMQMKMMQARMVPVGNVFSKFPRMVRDLANALHKNLHLDIVGETTEIDRTVIEHLADPLTHLIRNSVDHGIESPEEREKKGKDREGRILIRAYQEGSNIYIEVSDDGKGIDVDAVKAKAVENGLVTQSQISTMPIQEILNFIFEPGFSTKKEISDVSGRGVGMDVVKTQLEKLRGRIDITTKIGEGSKFTIVLPLTTTIVEALLVNVDRNIFAIPISVVEETLKVNINEIKDFDDYQIYNLRNETLAVIHLSDLVGMQRKINKKNEIFIVVISFERRRIGLVVNDLMGEQDIVIKGLDDVLKNNEGVAGAAVLGDGRIALILDTSTLVKAALKEINKLAKDYDIYQDKEGVTLSSLYDSLNTDKKTGFKMPNGESGEEKVKPDVKGSADGKSSDSVDEEDALRKINEIMNDIKNN